MNVKSIKLSVFAVMSAAAGVIVSTTAFAVERPELRAYPYKTSVTEGGTYANGSTVGTDFVVSGTISSALTFSSDVPYRVTLDGAAVSETITLAGDATLWLVGDNVIETTAATAVSSTGTLTIGGPGSVTLASSPTKKQTGPVVAENLVVAGGNVSIVLNADVKNVAGSGIEETAEAAVAICVTHAGAGFLTRNFAPDIDEVRMGAKFRK